MIFLIFLISRISHLQYGTDFASSSTGMLAENVHSGWTANKHPWTASMNACMQSLTHTLHISIHAYHDMYASLYATFNPHITYSCVRTMTCINACMQPLTHTLHISIHAYHDMYSSLYATFNPFVLVSM